MSVYVRFQREGFQKSFNEFVIGTRGDAGDAGLLASKIYARQLVGMTPPGDGAQAGKATLTKSDQRRGETAITRDLRSLFAAVKIKHKRLEQWPDVAGIHREAFIRVKGSGREFGRHTHRKFVDERKLRALQKSLFRGVGRVAAYWSRAAALVSVAVPAWVSRHSGIGGGSLIRRPDYFRFEAINPSIPPFLMADMIRREGYALSNTGRALEDSLRAILRKRSVNFNRAA